MPDLSSELTNFLSQHQLAATKVVTDAAAPKPTRTHPHRITMYVSFIPALKCFSAHREGMKEVRAASVPELLARLAELVPSVEFDLVLSKLARAEVVARKTGVPRKPQEPW
jgi:hypothetical protein